MLSKKSNAGCIITPDFKLYYRAIVTKTAWYWNKKRYVNQWNRAGDPEISPYTYSHLIFNKAAKNLC
jgi:hypothetical protein